MNVKKSERVLNRRICWDRYFFSSVFINQLKKDSNKS